MSDIRWLCFIKGHPFMTSTKKDQFFDPPTPTIRKMNNRSIV